MYRVSIELYKHEWKFGSFLEFSQTFTSEHVACASSVFLSSYRNMVLNQSARIFALGYFLNSLNVENRKYLLYISTLIEFLADIHCA